MRGFSPPQRVRLEFCRQAPGLRVNDETVEAEPGISTDDVLAQVEKDVVQMLSEHGGIITTSEFKSVCLSMGVNGRTFYLSLVRSPIISQYGPHLYGLIGSSCTSGPRARLSFPGHRLGKSARRNFSRTALAASLGASVEHKKLCSDATSSPPSASDNAAVEGDVPQTSPHRPPHPADNPAA